MPVMAAPDGASDSRPFFGRVESLRGLGAMLVAGYHFGGAPVNGISLMPDAPWPDAGPFQNALRQLGATALAAHAALMVFFVISGFVLRLSLQYGPQQPVGATIRFLLGRVFRMYPIVVFAVILATVVAKQPVTVREFFAHALLIDVSINGTWWALQVELIMAPIIVALYFLERSRGQRVLMFLAIVTSALAFKPSWALWRPISVNMFAFILGMLIPTAGRSFVAGLNRRAAGTWLAVALVLIVLPNPLCGRYSRVGAVIEGYLAFVLVSLVAYRPDLRALRWLDFKPLRLVGQASGSYYVLHMATVPPALAVAAAFVPASWSAAAPVFVGMLVLSVWLIAFAPAAVGTYYLIELPGIALGKRVMRRLKIGAKPAPKAGIEPAGAGRDARR